MSLRSRSTSLSRLKPHAFVALATITLFFENVIQSYQYSILEETVTTTWTVWEWVITVGGTYLVVPAFLFVAFYVTSGVGPEQPLTARLLVGLLGGSLAGSLLGQYVGGVPHELVFLITSNTFALDPGILRLWFDVFGPISRDFLSILGALVLAQAVQHRNHSETNSL